MSESDKLGLATVLFVLMLIGWAAGGYPGAVVGVVAAVLLMVYPWRGNPLWRWAVLYLRRNRPMPLADPVTVANDRSAGGVRYQDGVAAAAIQVIGRRHQPGYLHGSTTAETADVLDVRVLLAQMNQSLGLTIESLSVVSCGARRRSTGDYPRVYDTLVGTPPYAGQRETWLVVRVRGVDNGEALRRRSTIGSATLAATQRIAMALRCSGIRARVGTSTDITELERRLGATALEPHNRRWTTVRGEGGWQTTYAYRPGDINTATLAQAWALRADGIIQNVTLFPDGRVEARVTVRTAQPPTAPPAVLLQSLSGEQAQSIAANLCGPRPEIRRARRGRLPDSLAIPVGPSGVLLGKTVTGSRMLIPISDAGEPTRIHVAAEDAIAKRIIIRAVAAGENITVHTTNLERWETVRMPSVTISDSPRPAPATSVSVTDGTVTVAPRPGTVMSVGSVSTTARSNADILITQTGSDTVDVTLAGACHEVRAECYRAENRYLSTDSATALMALEMAD